MELQLIDKIVFGVFGVLFIAILIWVSYKLYKKVSIHVKPIINMSHPNSVVQDHPKFFISYKTSDGNDGLVQILNKELPLGSWLNKEQANQSVLGMEKGVELADYFICVISPKYFESKYTTLELDKAISLNKIIITVFNASNTNIAAALQFIPSKYEILKGKEIIPMQQDKKYRKVALEEILRQANIKTKRSGKAGKKKLSEPPELNQRVHNGDNTSAKADK